MTESPTEMDAEIRVQEQLCMDFFCIFDAFSLFCHQLLHGYVLLTGISLPL